MFYSMLSVVIKIPIIVKSFGYPFLFHLNSAAIPFNLINVSLFHMNSTAVNVVVIPKPYK